MKFSLEIVLAFLLRNHVVDASPVFYRVLYGTGSPGQESAKSTLYIIDPVTGQSISTIGPVVVIDATGNPVPVGLNGLTCDETTLALYGHTIDGGNYPNTLVSIDTTTGVATPIGDSSGGTDCTFDGLAGDSVGNIYSWCEEEQDDLYLLDKTTGVGILAGESGITTSLVRNGYAFDDNNVLHFLNSGDEHYIVNQSTGAAVLQADPAIPFVVSQGDIEPGTSIFYSVEVERSGRMTRTLVDTGSSSYGYIDEVQTNIPGLTTLAFCWAYTGGGGGPGGDPHIKKWNGETYNYHGQCDLVVTRSNNFGNGQGLELQIRTTIQDFYSFVSSAALRIGTSVLEVSGGKFMIDGVEHSDDEFPLKFAGYTLGRSFKLGTSKAHKLELNHGGSVQFRFFKDFMAVSIDGLPTNLGDAVGMMGNCTHGSQYARDGKTILRDHNAFGAEWQVRPGEDSILFQEARAPQWPQPCDMPVATKRHLRADASFVKRAEEVCTDKSPEDFDFCVEDVLATKDEGMAGAW